MQTPIQFKLRKKVNLSIFNNEVERLYNTIEPMSRENLNGTGIIHAY